MSPKDGRSWRWVLFFRCLSYTFPILFIISTTMAAIVVCCCVEPFSLPFFLFLLFSRFFIINTFCIFLLFYTFCCQRMWFHSGWFLFVLLEEAERWKYNNSQNKRRQTAIGTKKIASLRKITEQKERDRANDSQNEFDAKNGKYFVKYFEPWKKMRYIKISTKCRMEREWKKNEIGRRQTQNSIKNDVNSQIYRHLMLWRRIRVSIQMTIYSTSYSAILFFYLWLLRILFFSYFFYRHIALSLCW